MKNAATTWALVVGIDDYDDPAIPRLSGAARDAAAVVTWLRTLGVPDQQILLHAAPNDQARTELDALGLERKGCSEPEIWKSVHYLESKSGSRLFVFLSGHGLYEPGSKRLCLTQEATDGAMTNLGIDLYSDLFRSLRFPLQFLVMDGCLNLPYSPSVRSSVQATLHSGVAPKVPRADTTLVSCFAASQGERAVEADGRGLFLNTFLTTLDPAQPHPLVLDLDDSAGLVRLDVRRAVLDVVSPTVTDVAWRRFSRQQHPGLQVQGAGEAWKTMPIVEIEPEGTARLRVVIDPTGAVPDVRQIRIDSDDTAWRRFVPVPPARDVQVPVDSRVPLGMNLTVRCLLHPQVPWSQPGLQPVHADMDRELIIRLEPQAPAAPTVPGQTQATVQVVDSAGHVTPALGAADYVAIDRAIGPLGDRIQLERHETGPVLRASPEDHNLLSSVAARVARTVERTTRPEMGAVVVAPDPLAPATVRLLLPEGGARRLAGHLQDTPAMAVGDQLMSLRQAESTQTVTVEPGPVEIRLTLPWGSWSHLAHVDEGETAEVQLPERVGVPPLRVLVAEADQPLEGGNTVVLLDGDPGVSFDVVQPSPLGWIPGRLIRAASRHTSGWRAFDVPSAGTWGGVVALRRGEDAVRLPLHPSVPVLLKLAEGRAEPLSPVPFPTWDLLVSSGRLQDLSAQDMEALTNEKWEDPILGLAGAYACFAQERYEYLTRVLENLSHIDPGLPDVAVLAAANPNMGGRPDGVVQQRLLTLAEADAVPVLRWGVPLAVHAAQRHDLQTWHRRLTAIDAGLLASSVWTLWRPGPPPP